MMPKMILFDYGGTLMDEPDFDPLQGEKAVFAYIKENPRGITPEESAAWGTRIFQDYGAARSVGFELTELQNLRMQYEMLGITFTVPYDEIEEIYWDGCGDSRVIEGVPALLKELKAHRIRTGVISNIQWSGRALRRRIDRLLLEHDFEFVLASSDYGYRKPLPMLFDLALHKAGLVPKEVWYCGNSYDFDVKGAVSAGLYPILFHSKADSDLPHLEISEWKELIPCLERKSRS